MINIGVQNECLREKFSWSTCILCVDICLRKSLYLEKNNVKIEQPKCNQCGLCIIACPADAISGPPPLRNIENDLIHSDNRAVPSVKELLLYYHAGIRHIHLNTAHIQWLPVIDEVNLKLEALERLPIQVQQDSKPVENISSARRSLLGLRRHTPLSIKNKPLNTIFTGYRFFTLNLNEETCSLCSACQNVCTTQAIHLNDNALTIQTHLCTGCKLCVDACPDKSLTLEEDISSENTISHSLHKLTCTCCEKTFSDFKSKTQEQNLCSACRLRKKIGLPIHSMSQNSIANLYKDKSS